MKKYHLLIDISVLFLISLFIFSFFEPGFLFSLTTTTGGDTVSHYPSAVYLKEALLPKGKIMGWDQGNYAGYPLFYHYFPLTFIFMVLLSYVIPMQIAFKLITVLGTFLLPVCVYLAFRFLKYPFPVPVTAAIFSLAFLFIEANSMWGGNIPSTLAGEYSYSFSLAVMVLFFGSLYEGVRTKSRVVLNSFLIFLIGASHGFTLIFSGVISSFFLFSKKSFFNNLWYLFKVFGLAGLLLSFWLIPFLGNSPYVTSYVTRWHIQSIFKVIPVILIPFFALSFFSLFLNLFDRRTLYFIYVALACLILYLIAPFIGVLDIRFIPFVQLFVIIFGATVLMVVLRNLKKIWVAPLIFFLAAVLWVLPNVTYIKGWIRWNYEGFERKPSWTRFQEITQHLADSNGGRVVYEHSPAHNIFGSERAFENLPFWAKRKTLEGLYMQSSISAPFVFYIQSEISKVCSGPFPQYSYTSLNLPGALKRLKMFNVTQYIARSPEAKKQAGEISELKLEKVFGEYEIYRLTANDGRYVVPLYFEPVLFETKNWKKDFFEWFKNSDINDVHLVYARRLEEENQERFKLRSDSLKNIPKKQINYPDPLIEETINDEEIIFKTNLTGYPHLIKISYHPNWKVRGADKIYLVSPSFMLVYPEENEVRLHFGKGVCNYLGEAMSFAGLSIILISGIISFIHVRKT